MNRILFLLALALLVAACGDSTETTAPAESAPLPGLGSVAYTSANIWNGTGAAALRNANLVVRDGRVESISTDSAPEGARTVDLEGAWVVPGFINAHGHVSGRWAADEVQGDAARVEGDLSLYARYGVTTILSLGGAPKDSFGLRSAQDKASLDRARLLLAGGIVFSQDPAEAAAMTQANIDAGVDWIKMRQDDNLGASEKMSWDALEAALQIAAAANVPVATHIFYGSTRISVGKSRIRPSVIH